MIPTIQVLLRGSSYPAPYPVAPRHLRSKLSSPLTIVEGMRHPGLFGQWFSGPSWDGWEAIKKAQIYKAVSGDAYSLQCRPVQ